MSTQSTIRCGACKRFSGHEDGCATAALALCGVCITGTHSMCTGPPCECLPRHAYRRIAVHTQKVYVVIDEDGAEVMRTEDPDVAARVARQDTPGPPGGAP